MIKVGLITTMSPDKTWSNEIIKKVSNLHIQTKRILESIGLEVVDLRKIARTYQEMSLHGKELRYRGINVLIIYVGTWTYSNTAVTASIEADVPVIVWTDTHLGMCGITGASIVKGSLDEIGIYNNLVYGELNDKKTLDRIKMLSTSAGAVTKLRGSVYGLGGSRSMGMVTANIDANEWKRKFGIDVDGFEQVEVIEMSKNIPDTEAKKFLKWMKKEFGKIEQKDDVMLIQIKLYLALKKLIHEKKYDFISVKCLPELPACFTTFCLAHAFLNDKSDYYGKKEPFVCGCESDSNGALTMQILKNISEKSVMFSDVAHIDKEENIIRVMNCGSIPTDFAKSKKDVYWVKEALDEFKWKIGGTSPQFVLKSGEITLARLSRIKGKYVMLIVEGEAVNLKREKLSELHPRRAQGFIKLKCNIDDFISNLRSNHIHGVYGNYKQHLIEVCNISDITPVVL